MADKKITQLPSLSFISGSPTGYYAGEVVLPIVHNSTTVKMEAQKFALYATQWSATTASNTFIGNQTINGNVVVTGKLTAQEVHTEITSASIIFESGSTIFGNTADDTHTITGTINVNGKVVGNAPLDFTSQSLNIATGSYNRLYDVTSSVHFTTASLNTQTGSQQLINVQNSTVTSSLNLATASLNFTTGALNIASGSYNRFYQVTASVHSTTASLNQATSSLNFASGALEIATGSYNRFYQATASIHSTTSSLNQATSSLNFASGALNIATGSYNRFYDMTSSVHFTTQSLNVQTGSQDTINFNISKVTASIDAHILGISIYTASLISQTNTIATFTSSVNFATASLNTQTGSQDLVNRGISSVTGSINAQSSSQDLVNRRISSVTGSMNTQSSSQDSVNYQNSIVTSSFRNEIGGIEAYTASLKSAIVVNGNNVRIIGELSASRIYTEYITSSVLFVTGSNIIGDQSSDKHEFTGSVNINDTLFIKGQAIGLGELNAFSGSQINKDFTLSKVTASIDAHILGISKQTGSQDLVNLAISTFTGSLRTELNNIEALTASMKAAAIVSSSTQVQNYDVFALNSNLYTSTGSLIGITNGLMALTASMKAASIVSSSTQVQNYDVFALNSNLYSGTGSIKGEIAGIEAYTASLKAAAIVSSSQQVQNYFTFAKTGSANTFYGNQSVNGELNASIVRSNSHYIVSDGSAAAVVFQGYINNYLRIAESGSASSGGARGGLYVGAIDVGGTTTFAENLVMASGKGIDFSATSNGSGTTSSELLNDYEEGTWTPTITFGGGATSLTYNTQHGVYTKIGNVVHFSFRVILSNKGSSTGAAAFGGLPFTSANTSGNFGAVPVAFADAVVSFDKTLTWIVDPNATTINVRYCNGTNYVDMNDTNFTNSSNIIASGTYRTA